jgi:ribosomal protein L18
VLNSASEAEKTARELMKNEDAQKIAGAAAVGAVVAIVLPISMVTGAVIGAGIMAYNRFAK